MRRCQPLSLIHANAPSAQTPKRHGSPGDNDLYAVRFVNDGAGLTELARSAVALMVADSKAQVSAGAASRGAKA